MTLAIFFYFFFEMMEPGKEGSKDGRKEMMKEEGERKEKVYQFECVY